MEQDDGGRASTGTGTQSWPARKIVARSGAVPTAGILKGSEDIPGNQLAIRRMKSKANQTGWLEQHGALIGKLPDEEIARRVGKSRGYIKKIRLERGIHFNRKLRPWTPEEERLLGKYTDREVGRLLVRDIRAVANRRRALGRPPCGGSYNLWADYERDLLGTAPDREVARQLKRSLASRSGAVPKRSRS